MVSTKRNFTQQDLQPELVLVFERVIDVPPELVWAAWTKP